MGLHDAEEMLEAAKEQAILDERRIMDLQTRLDAVRTLCAEPAWLQDSEGAGYDVVEVYRVLEILDAKPAPRGHPRHA